MDLHVIGPLASPAERAAVDALLGPGRNRHGEAALVTRRPKGHVARGGHDARSRRDLLIPALHAVQARVGWISQPALNYVCRRLSVPPAEAYGVATFYALFATKARPPVVAHVCDDIACRLAGAAGLTADLVRTLGPAGAPMADGMSTWLPSPCLGLCERAPAAMFTVAGENPLTQVAAPVDAVGVSARLADATNGITPAPADLHLRRACRSPRPAGRGSGCSPASASSTRRPSTPTAPVADSGRSSGRVRSARRPPSTR